MVKIVKGVNGVKIIKTRFDLIFYLMSFVSALYFIIMRDSLIINTVGWGIFIAHMYQLTFHLEKWPRWCEYVGIIFAVGLMLEGNRLENWYAVMIGGLKIIAHIRQMVLNDGRYYY